MLTYQSDCSGHDNEHDARCRHVRYWNGIRNTFVYRACERELPVEQSQYSEIQRRIRHVAKCLYMRARALIIIAVYNARVSAGAVEWQDKDRFDSCCTRNQQRHSIIVFIASQIPLNEIHFLTTSIYTVIAA